MKITTFDPMIITKDQESLVALFEALGFERRHQKSGINDTDINSIRMRYVNEDGKTFHVDIVSAPVPRDITSIRMNVDHFDEAYAMLKEKGFINTQGDKITQTGTSKSTMMASPSGFTITVAEHIKE